MWSLSFIHRWRPDNIKKPTAAQLEDDNEMRVYCCYNICTSRLTSSPHLPREVQTCAVHIITQSGQMPHPNDRSSPWPRTYYNSTPDTGAQKAILCVVGGRTWVLGGGVLEK
jgi:hypothetical protein